MMNTILFDLDGTLLPIDDKEFERLYFGSMIHHFKDLYGPQEWIDLIWSCTKTMVKDTSLQTNETVFFKAMKDRIGDQLDVLVPRFEHFYVHDFDNVRSGVKPSAILKEAIAILKRKGYRLAIATNPMFPKLAIEKRIAWTGLDRQDFDYVTSFEHNHYCKPQPLFYREVCEQLKVSPQDCLMVGNDATEDMIAKSIGISTYLLTNHRIQKGEIHFAPDHEGDQDQFLRFVHALPQLS